MLRKFSIFQSFAETFSIPLSFIVLHTKIFRTLNLEQIPAELVLRQFCLKSLWFSRFLILDCLFSSQVFVQNCLNFLLRHQGTKKTGTQMDSCFFYARKRKTRTKKNANNIQNSSVTLNIVDFTNA